MSQRHTQNYLPAAGCLLCVLFLIARPAICEETPPSWAFEDRLEYGRYLDEVLHVLGGDAKFKKRMQTADLEYIQTGELANDLMFASLRVRNKLDELKRQELARLRRASISNGIRNHGDHVDLTNPHTFESKDFQTLITHATSQIDELDKQRKESFKSYELKKFYKYNQGLEKMTPEERAKAEKRHGDEVERRRKQRPSVHQPGSQQQYEEVWEKQDHLSSGEFNAKAFFHLHDLDGNRLWDFEEVKALYVTDLDKIYDPKAAEFDEYERQEEMERMREQFFKHADQDKNLLISYDEYLGYIKLIQENPLVTWDGLDMDTPFSTKEYDEYVQKQKKGRGLSG